MASFKIDEAVFDKLAEILKKHNLTEVEYKDGDAKIRISAIHSFAHTNTAFTAPPQIEVKLEPSTNETIDFENHKGAVKSPMVGTCYMAPEPGAPNFISIGDTIQEGQPILIIEAMKVMNLIKSPKSGKVINIAVSNSNPIEFGQLLVVIE